MNIKEILCIENNKERNRETSYQSIANRKKNQCQHYSTICNFSRLMKTQYTTHNSKHEYCYKDLN